MFAATSLLILCWCIIPQNTKALTIRASESLRNSNFSVAQQRKGFAADAPNYSLQHFFKMTSPKKRQPQAAHENSDVSEIQISYKPTIHSYRINHSSRSYDLFMRLWNKDLFHIQEQFGVLFLNKACDVIGYRIISTGSVDATTVDINLVIAIALKSLSKSIIIAHNHPSGNPEPSKGDKQVTDKLKKACALFDIEVLDHIILTERCYFSFQGESVFCKSDILNDGN